MQSGRRKTASSPRRHARRMTLVEMTVILSVIAILTAVLVPTIMSHVTQSRILRARQDVKVLGEAISRFYQDTGFVPKTTDSIDGRQGSNVVDLLVTAGEAPALPENPAKVGEWVTGKADYLVNHVVHNVPGYNLKKNADDLGWNGPYLGSIPEADPWGQRYMVNIVLLNPGAGVVDEDGNPKSAVFAVSAGPNGIIETPFDQVITEAVPKGDDIVYRLQ